MWDQYWTNSSLSLNPNLRSWIFAFAENNLFMMLLESTRIVSPTHSLPSFWYCRTEKRPYLSSLRFNDLTKLTIIMINKNLLQLLLHFSRSPSSTEILYMKNFEQYKKLIWDSYMMVNDDLVSFIQLLSFINASLP